MNVSIMLDELSKAVGIATKNTLLETKHGIPRAPQIIDGYLPPPNPKNPNGEEDFPFVIVRYLSDESDTDASSAAVKLICGAYSQDDRRGWQELLILMNVLRTYFLKYRRFGNCFEIELPIKRKMPEEQAKPQWIGEIDLHVTIPNIVEEDENVERFFIE